MNERRKDDEVDVLIVGAGPTGLTLACDLARRGVAVRIVERSREPFAGSRGKGLTPRTLEVLDDLGIVEQVLAGGSAYPRMRMHFGFVDVPWAMVKRRKATVGVPYPNVWMHPQNRTEAALRARLSGLGGGVDVGLVLTTFQQDARGVSATLSRGGSEEHVRARYLVGADGAHSVVRKRLGVPFEGDRLEGPGAVVGDVRVDGLSRDAWHVWPRAKGGPIALCPLPGGELFQLYAQRSVAADVEVTEAWVRGLVSDAIGKKAPQIREATWLSVFRPQARLVERYRVGRVFLAGDAAHVHPPSGGQGLNAGVQDAYNLGWKLGAVLGGAEDSLLATYEEERRPVAAAVLGLATTLFRKRSLRRGEDTLQLHTNYRGCSLSIDAEGRAGIRAGDRAPDAMGFDANGARVRLFDLFRGPHPTALAFGDDVARALLAERAGGTKVIDVAPAAESPVAGTISFVDGNGEVRKGYGAGAGAIVIVRPDGYVGFRGARRDVAAARAYLARMVALPTERPRAPADERAHAPVIE